MTPLAQLIDAVKATNNWSDPVLVENARKQGHELTKSNISRYRNEDPLISIKGSIIRALAAGLRVSASQVAVAAVESMGIHLPSYELPTIEQSIRIDSTIPERDRQVIMAMVREVRTLGASLAKQPADPLAAEAPQPRTPGEAAESKKNGAGDPRDKAEDLIEPNQPSGVDADTTQSDVDLAARDTGGISEGEQTRRDMDQQGEAPDPDGPEDGA